MMRPSVGLLAVTLALIVPLSAEAQTPTPQSRNVFESCTSGRTEVRTQIPDPNNPDRITMRGEPIVIICDDTQLFANEIVLDGDMFVASGQVLLQQKGLRVNADRLDMNRKTRFGTFYNARGFAQITETRVERSMFGTLEPHVHFRGERLEKTGPNRYRLTNGAFSTCDQPTPRWEMAGSSGTVILDDRMVLRNAVLKVKNVPLFYLPLLYYPLGEDDRSTGFLLPAYTASASQGSGLSNAFFLVLGRSQDATFYHDWFSKSGQAFAVDYRFVSAPGSDGSARFRVLSQRATATQRASRSYNYRAGINQGLPRGFRFISNVDYFTSIETQQLYELNIYNLSNRQRYLSAALMGSFSRYRLSANVEQRDYYYGPTSASRQGRLPEIKLSMGEKPIGRSRVYFGANGETAYLLRNDDISTPGKDRSLLRFDATPTLRAPLSRLSFLSVSTAASWHLTHWRESEDPTTGAQVAVPLTRHLLDLRAEAVGPVFARIWSPDNGYAERLKHLIEPRFSVQWLSPFKRFDDVVQIDSLDGMVGGTTTLTYGVTNRLLVRRRGGSVRGILSGGINQSYYSNSLASLFDPNYESRSAATKFSPLRINVAAEPVASFTGRFEMYIDARFRKVRSYSASATIDSRRTQITAGWSKQQVIPGLPGFNNPDTASHFLTGNANVKLLDGRIGGSYGYNFDVRRHRFMQQRIVASYNAQCCGVSVDYQTIGGGQFGTTILRPDRKFGVSFSLAGIGSFSNPFGSFGDNSGRR